MAKSTRIFGYYSRDTGDTQGDTSGEEVAKRFIGLYDWSINQFSNTPVTKSPPDSMRVIDVKKTSFFKAVPDNIVPSARVSMSFMALEPTLTASEALEARAAELSPVVEATSGGDAIESVAWDWYIDDDVER